MDTVSDIASVASSATTNTATIENKAQLVQHVREWVRIDNEMRLLQTKLNEKKKEKQQISAGLMTAMKQNEIHEFDLKDGVLMYTQKQVKKPISKKHLLTLLSKYFGGNETKADELNTYIMENREVAVQDKLVHKLFKN
jgi:hypothetical protein